MESKVQLWGKDLALCIPQSIAEDMGLLADTVVELRMTNGRLEVIPATTPENELDRLLGLVTDENRHEETDTGIAVGRETW